MNYTLLPVLSTESIGDSLSSINLNYLNLDEYITNTIQYSANNLWLPLKNYYKSMSDSFINVVNQATDGKNLWDSCTTLVSQNSAKWVEPLVVFYANPIQTILKDNDIVTITNWLNSNFPPNQNLYVENQKAYVNVIIQNQNINTLSPVLYQGYTTCVTSDLDIAFNCTTAFVGTAACSNGNKACGGATTCTEYTAEPCYYIQTRDYGGNGHYYYPKLQATLYMSYTDTYEDTNINSLVFNMQQCNWVYLKQI